MLAASIGETIKNFFTTGNNLYIVIAIAVAIVALIVIIAVSAPKKKNKTAAEEATETDSKASETDNAEAETVTEKEPTESADTVALNEDTVTETKETGSETTDTKTEQKEALDSDVSKKTPVKEKAKKKSESENRKKTETKSAAKKEETETAAAAIDEKQASDQKQASVEKADKAEKTEKAGKPVKKQVAKKSEESKEEIAASVATAEILNEEDDTEPELSEEDGKESRPGTVEIYKDARGEFHFRFRSMNGSIVGHSQSYKSKESCKNGIRSVISCCEEAIIADTTKKDSDYVQTIGRAAFEIYRDNADQFRYRLVAKNASNILASQGYTNKTNCIKGAESIIRMSKNHIVDDATLKRKKDAE